MTMPARHAKLFSLSVLIVLWLRMPTARAEIFFAEPTADAGIVRTGTSLRQRFEFVNRGTNAVEILDLRASCGCLTPRLEKRVFVPGEKGTLLLEVNTLTQPAGKHSWNVQVQYRDRDRVQQTQALLTAQLLTEVSVQPAALVIYTDAAVSHELLLSDVRPKPLTVTEVHGSASGLTPSVTEQGRTAGGPLVCRIRLAVAADFPEGRHEAAIRIYTDDPAYRDLKVPVTIVKRLRQRLAATPSVVRLAAPAGQPIPSCIVLIRDNDNEGVVVDKIVADDPAISCQWAQGPNRMATLRVRIDRQQVPAGGLQSAVHVHVRKPAPDVLTIPVNCSVP
jgi:hypothetical protein